MRGRGVWRATAWCLDRAAGLTEDAARRGAPAGGARMAGSDDETEVDATPVARAPAGELAPGTLLNGIYRIEARLGAGGMGEVYRATNLANDEVDAIKIIGRGMANQSVVEAMFRKEARVLSRIRSPAVAQLKLFMQDPNLGLLYFITDFVSGESLLDRLKRQPASGYELRVLMRRVLIGLQAVHEAGAVHRDLSPDNIILPGGDAAQATIIDFGIAKERDATHTTYIGDGFAGKLGYIAPEQLGFTGSEVGPWTDLYSLALVGVAFAAGRPLDMGHTVGRAEEARRGTIDLSAIPAELQPVFSRLLTYDWRARPQSATEALSLLEPAVQRAVEKPRPAEPPPSRLNSLPPKAPAEPRPAAQHPAEGTSGNLMIICLIVLFLSVVVVVVLRPWHTAKGAAPVAQQGGQTSTSAFAVAGIAVQPSFGYAPYQTTMPGDGLPLPTHGFALTTIRVFNGANITQELSDIIPLHQMDEHSLLFRMSKGETRRYLLDGGAEERTVDDVFLGSQPPKRWAQYECSFPAGKRTCKRFS